jgi:hypothetical protein
MIPFPVVQAIRSKARIAAKKAAVKECERIQRLHERSGNFAAALAAQQCALDIENRVKPLPKDIAEATGETEIE